MFAGGALLIAALFLPAAAKCLADQQATYNDRISGLLDP